MPGYSQMLEARAALSDDELDALIALVRAEAVDAAEAEDPDRVAQAEGDLDLVVYEKDARELGGPVPAVSFGQAKELVRARYEPTWDWGTFELAEDGYTDASHWRVLVGAEEEAFDPAFYDVVPGGPAVLVDRQSGEIVEVHAGLPGQEQFERLGRMRPVDARGRLLSPAQVEERESREAWYTLHDEGLRLRFMEEPPEPGPPSRAQLRRAAAWVARPLGLSGEELDRFVATLRDEVLYAELRPRLCAHLGIDPEDLELRDEDEDADDDLAMVPQWRPFSVGLSTLVEALGRPAHVVDRVLGGPWQVAEQSPLPGRVWTRGEQPEVLLCLDFGLATVAGVEIAWEGQLLVVLAGEVVLGQTLADTSLEQLSEALAEAGARTRRTFRLCESCHTWTHPGLMHDGALCMSCAELTGGVVH